MEASSAVSAKRRVRPTRVQAAHEQYGYQYNRKWAPKCEKTETLPHRRISPFTIEYSPGALQCKRDKHSWERGSVRDWRRHGEKKPGSRKREEQSLKRQEYGIST